MGLSIKKLFKGLKKIGGFTAPGQVSDTISGALRGGKKGKGPPGYPGDQGQEAALREGYGAALAQEAQSLGSIPKAYEKARTALGSGKSNAIQYAQDAGKQASAQADQSLASRGLYNTTILDNARQGVSANVSRQVADIEAQYAQIMGQLGLSENQAQNQVRGRIGQLHAGLGSALAAQGNQQQGLAYNYAGLNQQWELSQNPDAWLESLFQIGGTAFGYGLAGGFGGGGKATPVAPVVPVVPGGTA